MRLVSILGVLLLILGIVALVYDGIPLESEKETISVGPIEATARRERAVAVPAAVAIAAIVGGMVLLVVGVRGKKGESQRD